MKNFLKIIVLFVLTFALGACASNQEQANQPKPGKIEIAAFTAEAVVEAIDQQTRKVTLKGPRGNSYTITAGPEVRNLSQVEVGDTVMLEVIEAVAIQVFAADEAEPGAAAGLAADRAKLGEKPGAAVVAQLVVTSTIENIDLENSMATLKDAKGKSHTVKVKDTEALKRVVVGDKVMISYTEAVVILVEK